MSFTTCTHYKKNGHFANKLWKRLPQLETFIKCQKTDNKKQVGKSLNVQGKTSNCSSNFWVPYSGATHHMTTLDKSLSSISSSYTSSIEVGDTYFIPINGKGDITIDGVSINNVFYVSYIATNLLSIYQICASRKGKNVLFSQIGIEIRYIQDTKILIAKGYIDHNSRLFHFKGFQNP